MDQLDARDGLREKHLLMIQSIITRMAGNSCEIRKWSVGIVTLVLGFSVSRSDWRFGVLGTLAALVFWYLDGFYLWQERRFRTLFERVRVASKDALEANPYFLTPEFSAIEKAFPLGAGEATRRELKVSMAFRQGLVELHWLAITVPLAATLYMYRVAP